MKRYIIAFFLMATLASAQIYPVSCDGTNLVSAGGGEASQVVIASDFVGTSFEPSYGSFVVSSTPLLIATNVSVTNGTITSGSVTNTWAEDASYFVVQETGVFEIYFTFQNGGTAPRVIDFHGRYDGNPSHGVKFATYNYTNSTWDDFTADAEDLDSGSTDSHLQFTFPTPNINYASTNGESRVRLLHIGSAISSHDMYVDFIQLTYATAVAEVGGVWYDFATGTIEQQNNMTMTASNNTMITTSAGDYEWKW